MEEKTEKIPNLKELEKEISEFLSKKFGNNIKVVTPMQIPEELSLEKQTNPSGSDKKINFDLKPEDLVAYLDQYIVKQENAKSILATKICTHFNRIKRAQIGVPFVKGDATKFSETGYVGGDVEDLVRDLVREADNDIELAQYGIIYIDEIDKIASNQNFIGADVSRTGVQRALLKPMEETEIELKVPHDPISMIQEIEQYRKTGKREKRSVNTKNILFIMSGAFSQLSEIIQKRIMDKGIGFGAKLTASENNTHMLSQVKSEDIIKFGFESEFVGRLPVRTVFENLGEADLFEILKSPNNPIILGKKLDFRAYGIDIKFENEALQLLAKDAVDENTGARGLISAIERKLLLFENKLPSTTLKKFPVTEHTISNPDIALKAFLESADTDSIDKEYARLEEEEKQYIRQYVINNKDRLSDKYGLALTPSRIEVVAAFYCRHVTDIGNVIVKIKHYYDEIKKIELFFFKHHDVNIVLEDDAIDFIIEQFINSTVTVDDFFRQLSRDYELGLKLIRDKTGRNRFFITKQALLNSEQFLNDLIKNELSMSQI
jgi:ATP-dependent protease Clp ATPase subunit